MISLSSSWAGSLRRSTTVDRGGQGEDSGEDEVDVKPRVKTCLLPMEHSSRRNTTGNRTTLSHAVADIPSVVRKNVQRRQSPAPRGCGHGGKVRHQLDLVDFVFLLDAWTSHDCQTNYSPIEKLYPYPVFPDDLVRPRSWQGLRACFGTYSFTSGLHSGSERPAPDPKYQETHSECWALIDTSPLSGHTPQVAVISGSTKREISICSPHADT